MIDRKAFMDERSTGYPVLQLLMDSVPALESFSFLCFLFAVVSFFCSLEFSPFL